MPSKIYKSRVDELLKELAKEFQRQNGRNQHVEMIIVGGGSILINYNFREYTDDFDFLSINDRAIKDASIPIRDKYDLEYGWINMDFRLTSSYSGKLFQFSDHYKTFNNGNFEVRTIRGEYLIAMKMVSFRSYKYDVSDILGIMISEEKCGRKILLDDISRAFHEIYGDKHIAPKIWDKVQKWCSLSCSELESEYYVALSEEEHYACVLREEAAKSSSGISSADISKIMERAYSNVNKNVDSDDIEK